MSGIIAKCRLISAVKFAPYTHSSGQYLVLFLSHLRALFLKKSKKDKDMVSLFLHRTWAEIDLNALVHNFNLIKEMAHESKIMAVVKANAYGHSVSDIAPALDKAGTDYFAVSNIDEALKLRELGIEKNILILGYTPADCAKILADNNISQCVYSEEYASLLSKFAVEQNATVNIHIKLDTGMSRLGFDCRTENLCGIDSALNSAKLPSLKAEGIFTHFAVSDRTADTEDGFTDSQYKRFTKAVKIFEENGFNDLIKHCANSGAIIKDSDKHLDIVRPGIILYGIEPDNSPEFKKGFIPVMTFKSVVSMVKQINNGDTVSYGRTFTANKTQKIATVSVGYADGYPRILSNKSYVIINGKKAKILGRVCMDQMTVDVSSVPNVKMGDEVILFGKDLSVNELAETAQTIGYEIVCSISPRVPRIIVGEDNV